MVNRLTDDSDSELRRCLEEQGSVFEQAVMLIERLESAAVRRELGMPESVTQLQKSLDRVVSAQQQVSQAHQQFTRSRVSLTPELRRTLDRHESLLKTLIQRIDSLQGLFEKVRSELLPQLDSETRRRTMQAAYQQSMRQGSGYRDADLSESEPDAAAQSPH